MQRYKVMQRYNVMHRYGLETLLSIPHVPASRRSNKQRTASKALRWIRYTRAAHLPHESSSCIALSIRSRATCNGHHCCPRKPAGAAARPGAYTWKWPKELLHSPVYAERTRSPRGAEAQPPTLGLTSCPGGGTKLRGDDGHESTKRDE